MPANLSSTTSPTTTAPVRPLSEQEDEELTWIEASLSSGATLLRPTLARIQEKGLDARKLYQIAIEGDAWIRGQSGLPQRKLPSYEDLIKD